METHIMDQETQSLRSRVAVLEAALKELVELKGMHDKYEAMSPYMKGINISLHDNYSKRKPLAWQAARELIYPNEALKQE